MSKSTSKNIFLLGRFFNFKIDLSKDQDGNLNAFNKLIIQNINNCDEKVFKDCKAIILLNVVCVCVCVLIMQLSIIGTF